MLRCVFDKQLLYRFFFTHIQQRHDEKRSIACVASLTNVTYATKILGTSNVKNNASMSSEINITKISADETSGTARTKINCRWKNF